MANYKFIYNPITKQLDLVNSDSSGGITPTGSTGGVVIVDKVDNYSSLPAASGNTGNCYLVLNDQGTSWLPGSLGGTFYGKGVYYSNGVNWSLMGSVPYQATQQETDNGVVDNVFVTPLKLSSYSGFTNFQTQINNKLDADKFNESLNLSINTGVITGGALSINTDPTKFDVSDGSGVIVDMYSDPNPANAVVYNVSWSGLTAQTVTNLATSTVTFVLIDNTGSLVQLTTLPDEEELRDYIYLGQLGHSNLTSIATATSQPYVAQSAISQLRDLWTEIKYINDGNLISANGANLSIDKSNGNLTGLGLGLTIKKPNKRNYPAQTLATIRRRTQTGGTGTSTTLDVVNYDLGGTVTAITGTKSQNQRVYLLPEANIVIQYGQTLYNSLTDAIQGIENEIFVELENVKRGQLIAIISVTSNCTSLQDTSRARIKNVGKFGETSVGAGASSVSTMQQTYLNSITPEIDTVNGAVSLKNGGVSDIDRVIDVLNRTGGTVSYITGEGSSLFNNITGTTFVKTGGLSTQFLKADGSVDNNTYLTGTGVSGQVSYWNTSTSQTGSTNFTYSGNTLNLGSVSRSDTLLINGATKLTANDFFSVLGNVNTYTQINVKNANSGTTASADIVVSNNLGTDTTYYGDFGINSSTFSGSSSLFLPNAVYLTATNGDLVLGTTTNNIIRFVISGATTDALNLSNTAITTTLGTLVGTQTTQNVFTTVATTVNAFQAATTLSMGATTGTMTLRNSTIVGGGASLTLFNTTSTTIAFAGAATTLTIGGTPTTAITHNYSTNATANATTKTINFGTAGVSGSTTNINIGSSVTGAVGTLSINNSVVKLSRFTTNGFVKTSASDGTLSIDTVTYLPSTGYTAADVLSKLLTVDGTGSGLDADLLDGVEGANYIQKTSQVFTKTITVEAPTSTENITIFRTDVAITVVEVIAVSRGTSPSTTYQLKHGTDRSAAGSDLTVSAATTSTTTGNIATLSVSSIAADSWVWLLTTAATGTNVVLTVDIRYTIN